MSADGNRSENTSIHTPDFTQTSIWGFSAATLTPAALFVLTMTIEVLGTAIVNPSDLGEIGPGIGNAVVVMLYSGTMSLIAGGIMVLPATALPGIPAYFLLKRARGSNWLVYCLAGGGLGMVYLYLLVTVFEHIHHKVPCDNPTSNDLGTCLYHQHISVGGWLISAICGVVSALTFWLILRPDRAARCATAKPS